MKKDELVEAVTKHLRRLKREELVSLAERLDSKTLKLTDLTLSGEGGFGFQQGLSQGGSGGSSGSSGSSGTGSSGSSGSSGSASNDKGSIDSGDDAQQDDDEGGLLERSADAGRGLLRRAKGAVGG